MVVATTFTSSGGGYLSARWQNTFQIERWATGLLTPLPFSLRLAKVESGRWKVVTDDFSSVREPLHAPKTSVRVVVTTFETCEGGRDHLFQTLLATTAVDQLELHLYKTSRGAGVVRFRPPLVQRRPAGIRPPWRRGL